MSASQQINELEGSEIHRKIDELNSLSAEVGGSFYWDLNESVSAALRSVGFHGSYNGITFLEWYRDNLESLLRDHDDSMSAAPDLDEKTIHL